MSDLYEVSDSLVNFVLEQKREAIRASILDDMVEVAVHVAENGAAQIFAPNGECCELYSISLERIMDHKNTDELKKLIFGEIRERITNHGPIDLPPRAVIDLANGAVVVGVGPCVYVPSGELLGLVPAQHRHIAQFGDESIMAVIGRVTLTHRDLRQGDYSLADEEAFSDDQVWDNYHAHYFNFDTRSSDAFGAAVRAELFREVRRSQGTLPVSWGTIYEKEGVLYARRA